MLENIKEITRENVDNLSASAGAVAVFHKKLCPHCKILFTVIAKVRVNMPHVTFAAIDSEEEPALMEKFGVERVPSLVWIKNGKAVAQKTGVMNPKEMIAFIKSF